MKWSDFNRFDEVVNKHMPFTGEGQTKASQVCTAINKLIYKWFNDGDVFDNTHFMQGWVNDLSSYANWLAENLNGAREILDGIDHCACDARYTELLYRLADTYLNDKVLDRLAELPKVGSIYKCDGPYKFEEPDYDDEEDYEDEEYY